MASTESVPRVTRSTSAKRKAPPAVTGAGEPARKQVKKAASAKAQAGWFDSIKSLLGSVTGSLGLSSLLGGASKSKSKAKRSNPSRKAKK